MSSNSKPLTLEHAQRVAEEIRRWMAPHCEKVEVAGSTRRRKPEIGDIEIVAVPKWVLEPNPADLFGDPIEVNLLFRDWAGKPSALSPFGTNTFAGDGDRNSRPEFSPIQWIKPNTSERIPWRVQPYGKYWRAYLSQPQCNLDIWLTTPENFGAQLLIRTGSQEFSTEVVTHALRVGFKFDEGFLWKRTGFGESASWKRIDTFTEADVFRAMNLRYVAPEDRVCADVVVTGWVEPATESGAEGSHA